MTFDNIFIALLLTLIAGMATAIGALKIGRAYV